MSSSCHGVRALVESMTFDAYFTFCCCHWCEQYVRAEQWRKKLVFVYEFWNFGDFHFHSAIDRLRRRPQKLSVRCPSTTKIVQTDLFFLVLWLRGNVCASLWFGVVATHSAGMPSIWPRMAHCLRSWRDANRNTEKKESNMIEDDALNWRYVYPHFWHVVVVAAAVVRATTNNYHSIVVTIKRREQENMRIAKTKEWKNKYKRDAYIWMYQASFHTHTNTRLRFESAREPLHKYRATAATAAAAAF